MNTGQRNAGLDAWRGAGVLFVFHLLFFGQHIEGVAPWLTGPDLAGKIYARLADLLFTSGVLGLDMLFLVSGALVALQISEKGRGPAALVVGRYKRLLPFIALTGLPFVAYQNLSPIGFVTSLVLLEPVNISSPLLRAFGHANAFLLFSLLAAAWAFLIRRFPTASPWSVAATGMAWATATVLAASGPAWLPVSGHFSAFFWGVAAAWLFRTKGWGGRIPGWVAVVALVAAMVLCRKFSAARGDDLYFLLDARDWPSLGYLSVLQLLLACGLGLCLRPGVKDRAVWPLTVLGRASNCFFMVCLFWSFTLTRAYAHQFDSPVASLAFLYALTLGITLASALVLAPFLERAPLADNFSGKTSS